MPASEKKIVKEWTEEPQYDWNTNANLIVIIKGVKDVMTDDQDRHLCRFGGYNIQ